VSCPNYTFEVLSWVGFSLMTSVAMSWVFTLVGLAQMSDWALKKHRAYVKDAPDLKRRAAIIPFLL
jgi:very-long-chain enoyl-CoA reductase